MTARRKNGVRPDHEDHEEADLQERLRPSRERHHAILKRLA